MYVKASTFRLFAVVIGVVGLFSTMAVSQIYWQALGAGAVFGAGGLLFDYLTDSRFGRGQVSAWLLVAGGAALIFANAKHPFLLSDGYGGWVAILQYVASMALVWGLLLFVLSRKS